jgi:hypothetical protein
MQICKIFTDTETKKQKSLDATDSAKKLTAVTHHWSAPWRIPSVSSSQESRIFPFNVNQKVLTFLALNGSSPDLVNEASTPLGEVPVTTPTKVPPQQNLSLSRQFLEKVNISITQT